MTSATYIYTECDGWELRQQYGMGFGEWVREEIEVRMDEHDPWTPLCDTDNFDERQVRWFNDAANERWKQFLSGEDRV